MFPRLAPEVIQAMKSVRFIAQHIKDADKDNEVCDFKYQIYKEVCAYLQGELIICYI